jgi:Holliday junction resolvasome RuvABC DNA-binding subunit
LPAGTSAGARADVRAALGGLGYSDAEVREVMADLPPDGDAGSLLRDALQRLGAARR